MIFRRQTYDIVIIVVKLNSGVVRNLARNVTAAHFYNLYIILLYQLYTFFNLILIYS